MWERNPAAHADAETMPRPNFQPIFSQRGRRKGQTFHPSHIISPPKTSSVLITKRIPFPFNSQIQIPYAFNNAKKESERTSFGGQRRPKCRRHRLSQSSQKVVQVKIADEAKDRKKYKPMVRALKVRRPSDARRAVAEMAMNVWAQLVMFRSIESVKPQALVVVAIVRRTWAPMYLII